MFSTYLIFSNDYGHPVIICDMYNHLFKSLHFTYLIICINSYGYQQGLLFLVIYGPNMSSKFNKLYIDGFLIQWDFHRVQEHPKRSSDEEVMTFRSLRSHMSSQPYPASLPDLPFPSSFSTHCHAQSHGWNLDSMGFP